MIIRKEHQVSYYKPCVQIRGRYDTAATIRLSNGLFLKCIFIQVENFQGLRMTLWSGRKNERAVPVRFVASNFHLLYSRRTSTGQ